MKIFVATCANWNNFEMIFGSITFVMMIMTCLFWTIRAFKSRYAWQLSSSNSNTYSYLSDYFLSVIALIFQMPLFVFFSSLILFVISFLIRISFWRFAFLSCFKSYTYLALVSMAIFAASLLVKFRELLDLAALTTKLGLNKISHKYNYILLEKQVNG